MIRHSKAFDDYYFQCDCCDKVVYEKYEHAYNYKDHWMCGGCFAGQILKPRIAQELADRNDFYSPLTYIAEALDIEYQTVDNLIEEDKNNEFAIA